MAVVYHFAVLFIKDTFEADIITKLLIILVRTGGNWALEGMVAKGRLRRLVQDGRTKLNIMNAHVNNNSAR